MAELTINQIIKIIIVVFVIVVVVGGIYLAFKEYIIPYIKGIGFGTEKIILGLLK